MIALCFTVAMQIRLADRERYAIAHVLLLIGILEWLFNQPIDDNGRVVTDLAEIAEQVCLQNHLALGIVNISRIQETSLFSAPFNNQILVV